MKSLSIKSNSLDGKTLNQIYSMAKALPFDGHIAIMPDAHLGKGSCIGFTMPLGKYVVPDVVGVDIGCGIAGYEFEKYDFTKEELRKLDSSIKNKIPLGFKLNEDKINIDNLNRIINKEISKTIRAFNITNRKFNENPLREIINRLSLDEDRVIRSLGTLGGGNHFIEFGKSQNNGMNWFIIHTGSRNFGLKICNHHSMIAKTQCNNAEYSYLTGNKMNNYLVDMTIAQTYAKYNRMLIANKIQDILKDLFNIKTSNLHYNTIHNYINHEDKIIRKGAISAMENEVMLIPMNMSYGTLICEGKGNKTWNYSAPHGAGRKLSRSQAKIDINLDEFEKQMKGIHMSKSFDSLKDEAPNAYKNVSEIIDNTEETFDVLDIIKPYLNIKG